MQTQACEKCSTAMKVNIRACYADDIYHNFHRKIGLRRRNITLILRLICLFNDAVTTANVIYHKTCTERRR
jgi:hypothetical protein